MVNSRVRGSGGGGEEANLDRMARKFLEYVKKF
jgi:hypothetical protein